GREEAREKGVVPLFRGPPVRLSSAAAPEAEDGVGGFHRPASEREDAMRQARVHAELEPGEDVASHVVVARVRHEQGARRPPCSRRSTEIYWADVTIMRPTREEPPMRWVWAAFLSLLV